MGFKFCEACNSKLMITMRICPQCGGKSFSDSPSILHPQDQTNQKNIGANAGNSKSINQHPINSQARPWLRFWARTFDVYVFAFIAGFFLAFIAPEFISRVNEYILGLILVFSWIFVESLLLLSFGTTPGKWLLNISILSTTGSQITYSQSLSRSMKVWWRGYGIGFPIIQLITSIMAYKELTISGYTSWDKEEHFAITHGKVSFIKGALVTIVILGLLIIVGQYKNHSYNSAYQAQSYKSDI